VPYFADSVDSAAGFDMPSSINTWILAITASSKQRSDNCGKLDLGTKDSAKNNNNDNVTTTTFQRNINQNTEHKLLCKSTVHHTFNSPDFCNCG